jgi:hypothetical protein
LRAQAWLPAALGALHTFIRSYDPDEINDLTSTDQSDSMQDSGLDATYENLATGHVGNAERNRADQRRDEIAELMWVQYVEELRRRGLL